MASPVLFNLCLTTSKKALGAPPKGQQARIRQIPFNKNFQVRRPNSDSVFSIAKNQINTTISNEDRNCYQCIISHEPIKDSHVIGLRDNNSAYIFSEMNLNYLFKYNKDYFNNLINALGLNLEQLYNITSTEFTNNNSLLISLSPFEIQYEDKGRMAYESKLSVNTVSKLGALSGLSTSLFAFFSIEMNNSSLHLPTPIVMYSGLKCVEWLVNPRMTPLNLSNNESLAFNTVLCNANFSALIPIFVYHLFNTILKEPINDYRLFTLLCIATVWVLQKRNNERNDFLSIFIPAMASLVGNTSNLSDYSPLLKLIPIAASIFVSTKKMNINYWGISVRDQYRLYDPLNFILPSLDEDCSRTFKTSIDHRISLYLDNETV